MNTKNVMISEFRGYCDANRNTNLCREIQNSTITHSITKCVENALDPNVFNVIRGPTQNNLPISLFIDGNTYFSLNPHSRFKIPLIFEMNERLFVKTKIDINFQNNQTSTTIDSIEGESLLRARYSIPILRLFRFERGDGWIIKDLPSALREATKEATKKACKKIPKHLCRTLCNEFCTKKKIIKCTTISFMVLSGVSSYYFDQEYGDYCKRYQKEWDESKARELRNKAKKYRDFSYITAAASIVGLIPLFYFRHKGCKPLKLNSSDNQTHKVKIEPSFQKEKCCLILRY
jgi:hypothetical protein